MTARSCFIVAVVLVLSGSIAVAQDAPAAKSQGQFKLLDKNNDGFITPDELGRPKLFQRLDANADGKISQKEAAAVAGKARKGNGGALNRKGVLPKPSFADVQYGADKSNVFDMWQAKSDKPAPLVVFIHGGGFRAGDKTQLTQAALKTAQDGGAAVMSIQYRFLPQAPIQDILRDCARSIQFVRLNAAKYNIDPKRIACFGGSAGAGASLWLAAHPDLADPKSDDPVLRQTSRISAAACLNCQATYDLMEWQKVIFPFKQEWLSSKDEVQKLYHFKSEAELESLAGQKVLDDCSMLRLLSPDDPPVWMWCSIPDGEPKDRNQVLHHPKHLQMVGARCKEVGVSFEGHLQNDKEVNGGNVYAKAVEFLLKHLQSGTK